MDRIMSKKNRKNRQKNRQGGVPRLQTTASAVEAPSAPVMVYEPKPIPAQVIAMPEPATPREYARPATDDDIPSLLELLRSVAPEYPPARICPINYAKALANVRDTLLGGFVILAMRNNRAIGSIGLFPAQWWFGDGWFLFDRWTVVHPQYRKSRAFELAVRMAKDFADRAKTPLVLSVLSEERSVDRKDALLSRHATYMGGVYGYGFEESGQ